MTNDTNDTVRNEFGPEANSPLLMDNDKKMKLVGSVLAAFVIGGIATVVIWPKDQALAVEFTLGQGEAPAKYVGTIASLAIAERCGLPVRLGTGNTTVKQAREHLRIDPAFTDKVPIVVVAKPGSQFRIVGDDITCPGSVAAN